MSYIIKIFPSSVEFTGKDDETILDSALSNDVHLEHSCKNGDCGVCESEIISGKAINAVGEVFSNGDRILTCNCRPNSDLQLQANYFPELAGQVKKIVPCKVTSAIMGSEDVLKLVLRLPPTSQTKYLPGQYINLQYKGVIRSYSVANANEDDGIELHIRNVPNGQMSSLLFDDLKENTLMRLEGPCGTFFIRHSERPIIFLAGGTGFAPVKAMVEHLLQNKSKREIYIYWGMPTAKDFYSNLPTEWSILFDNVHFIPVVSSNDEIWLGRKGLVHHAVMEDFSSLESFDIYACGSPLMINASKKDFIAKNLSVDNFYSDAFTASK